MNEFEKAKHLSICTVFLFHQTLCIVLPVASQSKSLAQKIFQRIFFIKSLKFWANSGCKSPNLSCSSTNKYTVNHAPENQTDNTLHFQPRNSMPAWTDHRIISFYIWLNIPVGCIHVCINTFLNIMLWL